MRIIILATMAFLLAGCTDPYQYPAGGSKDCPVDPLEDLGAGYRVTVPEYVIPEDERTGTEGWCVEVHEQNGGSDAFRALRVVDDRHVVALPAGPEGSLYSVTLYVVEPDDRYCSYLLEATDLEHPGTVFVDVELTYDGVSSCT